MPPYINHILQARHNEDFGIFLKGNLRYKDWLITICYYAALHYVEATFANIQNIQHSTWNIPKDSTGKDRYSVHSWRKDLIKKYLPSQVYVCYSKLEQNSQIARYLDPQKTGSSDSYFQDQDVVRMFDNDLQRIKQELRIT